MSTPRQLPPGFDRLKSGKIRWRIQLDGKRITGTADTYTEAQRDRSLAAITGGGEAPPAAPTVAEIVAHYFDHYAGSPVSRQADERAASHLPDVFAHRIAADVRPAHIGALWAQLLAAGVYPSACDRLAGVMSKAWRAAAAFGWVDRNPWRDVDAPSGPQATEVRPPTPDDVRAIIAACRTAPMALIVRLAAVTGARRGELCAIQWGDLRLDVGELVIRRSLAEADRQLHVGDTKTGRKGHRTIPLDPGTIRLIRAHRRVVGCDWVFTHDGATPWRPPYVTLEYQRTRARVGVPSSFHGLRHYAATQWLAAGTPPSQVAGFLGHSTVATVLRTYSHFIPAQGRDTITAHAATLDG